MNKIIGSSKDFKKSSDTSPKKNLNKPLVDGLEEEPHREEKGLIITELPKKDNPKPTIGAAGLELPAQTDVIEPEAENIIEQDIAIYRKACAYVCQIMADASQIDINPLAEHAQRIIDRVSEHDGLLRLAMRPVYIEPFLGAHPVNVAILAAVVAQGRMFDEQQQLRTVVTGLVHDIGMSRLDPEVLQNQRDLTIEEREEIEQHPNYGAEIILEALGESYNWLANAVRQEHERANGRGYPLGLPLEKIGPIAQLTGLLDVYEAIIHPRRQHDAYCPSKALKQVIETRNDFFSSQMIKALLEAISMYPIETYVMLNTGQIARVTATLRNNPVRPIIEIHTDHNRQLLVDFKKINLQEYPVISIIKSLDIKEIEELAPEIL